MLYIRIRLSTLVNMIFSKIQMQLDCSKLCIFSLYEFFSSDT